jgi:hypothetical protein
MKNKRFLLIIAGLLVAFIVNSCKKNGVSPIHALFSGGTWQLASIEVKNFTGNQLIKDTTYNVDCVQNFTFNNNGTCTYTNFDCITQAPPAAPWTLSGNELFLMANVVCQDTSAAKSSMPFANCAIQNLGHYSLILETGDIQPNYSLTSPRTIYYYGFVRQQVNGSD